MEVERKAFRLCTLHWWTGSADLMSEADLEFEILHLVDLEVNQNSLQKSVTDLLLEALPVQMW